MFESIKNYAAKAEGVALNTNVKTIAIGAAALAVLAVVQCVATAVASDVGHEILDLF